MLHRLKIKKCSKKSKGFALPTVLVASLIMLIVLFASISSIIAVRSAIKLQYYNQLAKSAAEAGLTYAKSCLDINGGEPQNTSGNPLKPNTNCAGVDISTVCSNLQSNNPPTCTSNNKNISSSFSVNYIDYMSDSKSVIISSVGTTNLLKNDGTFWKSYSKTSHLRKNVIPRKVNSSGYYNSCAIDNFDQAYCWGNNKYGQLGDGSERDITIDVPHNTPVKVINNGVMNNMSFLDISVGWYNTCAIASDNHVYCWGQNGNSGPGSLGINSTITYTSTPVKVQGELESKEVISISNGNQTNCAISSEHKAYCWGSNYYGALGQGYLYGESLPITVKASDNSYALYNKSIDSISVGFNAVCVVTDEHKAYCWGDGTFGQLGDGESGEFNGTGNISNFYSSTLPKPVRANSGDILKDKQIKAISVGTSSTCAIANNGILDSLYCWGSNKYGQLGDGGLSSYVGYYSISEVPVAVKANELTDALHDKNIISISVGWNHACAVSDENIVYCWGNASGINSNVPTRVSGLDGKKIISVSAGNYHTCAISTENIVYCWGSNVYGQTAAGLGIGFSFSPIISFTPASNFYYY